MASKLEAIFFNRSDIMPLSAHYTYFTAIPVGE
jgi:hypothetical protein